MSAHGFDDLLGDTHPQTRAAKCLFDIIVGLGKWFENFVLLLVRHTDAAILDDKQQLGLPGFVDIFLHAYFNMAALGKFHGIGQQIV